MASGGIDLSTGENMRHKFEIFCTPKPPKPVIPGLVSFIQLLQTASLSQQYNEPTSSYSTDVEWFVPGQQSRKVISRSNMKATGKFPSRKNGRSIHCESKHELNAMVILENCEVVSAYHEQPAIITFIDAHGVTRKHYPDILVELLNGNKLVIEIKSDKYSACPETLWRTSHLHEQLKAVGIIYLLILESQLTLSQPFIKSRLIGDF